MIRSWKARDKIIPADHAVILAFKDVQQAYALRDDDEVSPLTLRKFERQAWDRLIRYLIKHASQG